MGTLLRFILGRIASAGVTLLGVSVVVFTAIRMIPGKFEEVLVPRGNPEFRAAMAEKLGLDHPLPVQYFEWLGELLQGDFGLSLLTVKPVAEEFANRVPVTAEISLLAALVALVVGVPLGLMVGLGKQIRGVTTAGRLFSGFSISVPDFVVASMLLYFLTSYSLWLTAGTWVSFGDDPIGHIKIVVAPVVTLSLFGIGVIAATSRHSAISVLRQEHVTAAILRGASPGQVIRRHVIRNASIPVVTIAAIYLGYLLGGTILVELIYSVPGVGRYMLNGVLYRDYVVVQASVMLAATFFIVLNMLSDIAYAWLDPRIRTGDQQ